MNSSEETTVRREESFDAIDAREWNEAVAESSTCSVFQGHEWQRTWWQTFQQQDLELILLVAREAGKPIGIASMYIDRHRVVRFVGHGRSDYADLICPAERDDVRSALLRQLRTACEPWNRIQLRHLPALSPTYNALRTSDVRMLQTDSVPCPTLMIEGHRDFFEQARKKKSLRRHHNYFRKQEGYRAEHLRRADEILPLLDAFFQQHIMRWSATEHPSLFNDEINRQFYRAIVQSLDSTDSLRFTRLSIGDRPIAFHFGFNFAGTFYWYKPSYDPSLSAKSPGEALLKELLDLAADEQVNEFDFTIGDEPFKQRFSNHTRHNIEATLYASPLDFRCQSALYNAKSYLRSNRLGRPVFDFAKRMAGKS